MESAFLASQVLMFISLLLVIVAFQIKQDQLFRISFVLAGVFAGAHFLLLGAFTAAVMVFINTSRWLVSIFSKSKYLFWLYIALFCAALYFTYESWLSLIPFVAGILGTMAVFQENQLQGRKVYMGVDLLWIVNNILVNTPVGVISHIMFLLSGIIGYTRLRKDGK